jgi:CRP-like cAMP-binding protein
MDTYVLRHVLDQISELSDQAWKQIEPLVTPRQVTTGEHLLRAGERSSQALFVRGGLLREYYIDDAGHETTRSFCVENGFSGSLADLLTGAPAAVSIESLCDGEVWQLNWAALDAIAELQPTVMKLLRRFAEGLYIRKMTREFEMLTLPAAERYRRFVQAYPDLDTRLQRHMVASYLGITPVHLSRICAAEKRSPI